VDSQFLGTRRSQPVIRGSPSAVPRNAAGSDIRSARREGTKMNSRMVIAIGNESSWASYRLHRPLFLFSRFPGSLGAVTQVAGRDTSRLAVGTSGRSPVEYSTLRNSPCGDLSEQLMRSGPTLRMAPSSVRTSMICPGELEKIGSSTSTTRREYFDIAAFK